MTETVWSFPYTAYSYGTDFLLFTEQQALFFVGFAQTSIHAPLEAVSTITAYNQATITLALSVPRGDAVF